jgi:diguanylate cyclase (GGDEF)-like protein/PAS domain S-box-containing protein
MKTRYYYIAFVAFTIVSYLFFKLDIKHKIQIQLDKETEYISQDYKLVYRQSKQVATIIFLTKIDTPEVKKILDKVDSASEKQKDQLRKQLYTLLKEPYKLLQNANLKQLHFHLKNNNSFLRVHKPEKFGDNLTNVRATVKYVNDTHKPIDGFEEGRLYNGYRFVFPLFLNERYLGSVEISFSSLSMSKIFYDHYTLEGRFLIAKDVIKEKVFDFAQSNYRPSQLKDFYYEKSTNEFLKKYTGQDFVLPSYIKSEFEVNAFSKKTFSLYDQKSYVIYTFVKVMNPVTKKVVAIFMLKKRSMYLDQMIQNSFALFILTVLLFAFFLITIYRMKYERKLLNSEIENKTYELQKANEELEKYVHLIDKNVIISSTDLHGKIIDVSEAFCEISGYTREELIGANHNLVRHPDMNPSFFRNLWKTIQNDEIFEGEIKNKRKDGSYYWVETIISPNYDEAGQKVGYTAIRHDITNKKKIEEISITDDLTKVYNRRHFNNLFPKIINRVKRENGYLSFLMIDIDHFKQYNDTYGHLKGDEVLQQVAASMSKNLKRATDYCFRIGGEEFAIVFKVESIQDSYLFAENIRRDIEELYIEHKSNSTSDYVTISIGLISLEGSEVTNDIEIYKEADKLLYLAKEGGRNRIKTNFSS